MEYLFIYLLQIFESFEIISIVLLLAVVALIIILFIFSMENKEIFNAQNEEFYKEELIIFNTLKKTCMTISIAMIIMFLIPTKQTLVLMGGVYYGKMAAKQITTSEKIKKVNEIIDLQLDKVIKELKN